MTNLVATRWLMCLSHLSIFVSSMQARLEAVEFCRNACMLQRLHEDDLSDAE